MIRSIVWVHYKSDYCRLAEKKSDSTKELGRKMADKLIFVSLVGVVYYTVKFS
jgi:hypothetical protein